ncbi:phenylalanine--tRNA ligase beta subunit-related protein, partial [Gammaproteobacteria bacterium]|nr:phenylalanine--tRNA ligase beta subunit-related protein [Gammaproteobacteria bacterium]
MNISYRHIVRYFYSEPSVKEISEKLFQLGHENEIEENDILNIEFTPNKGDCLSLKGIVRDLGIFYETKKNDEIFEDPISFFDFKFKNLSTSDCPKISFLKIEIEGDIFEYKDNLRSYFDDLDIKKNNFFTDVSNYVAYETGQPTHCYDAKKIKNEVQLKKINSKTSFNTLIDKEINLTNENLVFCIDDEVINLAGVMGGKSTSCSGSTTEVIVECAYFKPESIIGKSLKYDLQSDAAYKFERGVDPSCHEDVLRRFIFIVSEHAKLKSIKLFTESHQDIEEKKIQFDVDKIKKIIGIDIKEAEYKNMLLKLGFGFENQYILIPTYRSDIETQNDLAEEVSRIIGYDEIPREEFKISKSTTKVPTKRKEQNIKNFLIDNGFFEIINNPFTSIKSKGSIKIDNPLDSNRKFLRSNLKNSLVENLLYNERRQKDSIKLFEISDVYFNSNEIKKNRLLGIIASGRVGKNYRDFSRWINEDYLSDILDRFQI